MTREGEALAQIAAWLMEEHTGHACVWRWACADCRMEALRRAAALAAPSPAAATGARCATCGRPATCLGVYEDPNGDPRYGCDACCGHGQEDGHCYRLPAAPPTAAPAPSQSEATACRHDWIGPANNPGLTWCRKCGRAPAGGGTR